LLVKKKFGLIADRLGSRIRTRHKLSGIRIAPIFQAVLRTEIASPLAMLYYQEEFGQLKREDISGKINLLRQPGWKF
jgi:hypothetical protein